MLTASLETLLKLTAAPILVQRLTEKQRQGLFGIAICCIVIELAHTLHLEQLLDDINWHITESHGSMPLEHTDWLSLLQQAHCRTELWPRAMQKPEMHGAYYLRRLHTHIVQGMHHNSSGLEKV